MYFLKIIDNNSNKKNLHYNAFKLFFRLLLASIPGRQSFQDQLGTDHWKSHGGGVGEVQKRKRKTN